MGDRRTLWIHQNFVSRGQAGNSRPVLTLAALLERGRDVDLVAADRSYLDQTAAAGAAAGVESHREEGRGSLRIERVSASARGRLGRRASYLAFTARATAAALRRPRPDVVFCSSPPLPQALPALLLSAHHGVPLVLELRDLWPAMLVEAGVLTNPAAIAALAWLEAAMVRYAAVSVPVTPGLSAYLEHLGVPDSDRVCSPTGADRVAADPDAGRSWRAEHGLEGRLVVLYTGSMHQQYGIAEILEAAARCRAAEAGIHWVFAGEGRERARVTQAASAFADVHDLGPTPKTLLRGALQGADVGLVSLAPHPMFRAALPGKLFDYLAAGLPVLSNVAGHPRSILERSGAGLHCPASGGPAQTARALADGAIAMARRSPAERRAMGDAGRVWVGEHFDGASAARRLAELVDDVAEGRAAAAGPRRLLEAVVGGLLDVATGRSAAAAAALSGPDSEATLERALETWLRRPRTSPGEPLEIPELLVRPAGAPRPGPERPRPGR